MQVGKKAPKYCIFNVDNGSSVAIQLIWAQQLNLKNYLASQMDLQT